MALSLRGPRIIGVGKRIPLYSTASEERQNICECGLIFNDEVGVKWHRTTPGYVWHKLKAETNNNYVYVSNYAKTRIPENSRCDICNQMAHLKKVRVYGKSVPDWYVLDKEKLTVRCRKCKKEQLYLMKARFAELV